MIRKQGNKYVLISKTTGRVLGTHNSRKEAEAQEAAINIAKHKRSKKKK